MAVPGSGRSFDVAVISPQQPLFQGSAKMVVVPAYDGEVGILHNHAPMMALLGEGTLRIETDTGTRRFHISGGFVQVLENNVSILSEEAREA